MVYPICLLILVFSDHCGDDTDWVFKNGYCYLFKTITDISEAKSWHEAERFCNQNGGYLASIHSRDDSNFILSVVRIILKSS